MIHRVGVGKRAVLLKLREAGDVVKKADGLSETYFLFRPARADRNGAGVGGNTDGMLKFKLMHRVENAVYAKPGNVGTKTICEGSEYFRSHGT